MTVPCLLAIDAGTGSVRAVLFDAAGHALAQASRAVDVKNGDIRSEIDPHQLWASLISALREVTAGGRSIAAIGITAALGTILTTRNGDPLTPILTWQDRRAVIEAETIRTRIGAETLISITGRRADAELTAARLLWFATHAPQILDRAECVLTLKDWLVLKLTGEIVTDPASASYSLLFNVFEGAWSQPLIDGLGIDNALLPAVRAADAVAGTLSSEFAFETGLAAGIPVVTGGPDGTVGVIGGGLTRPGVAVDVMGTTDVIFACTDICPDAGDGALVINTYPANRLWSIGGPMAATGGLLNWMARLLKTSIADLIEAAARIKPGCDGLMVFPNLAGSRAPRWNLAERGRISGLSFDHDGAHLFRAALEGTAYEIASTFAALNARGIVPREIRAVGGGTENVLWMDIRAAVLNTPLIVPEVIEASSLGSAMLAAVGIGLYNNLDEAGRAMIRIARQVDPRMDLVRTYADLRPRWLHERESG
jgi:xylulokinase